MTTCKENIHSYLTNFFIDFNAGKDSTRCLKICRQIVDGKKLSKINIQSYYITKETLDSTIKSICEELFHYQCKKEYIITLLAFSIELDKHLKEKSWYHISKLINILTLQLERIEFDPRTMLDEFNYSWFLILLPVLLLLFYLFKK